MLGELSALADAACWAGVGVTTKRVGRAIRPVHMTLFLTLVSASSLALIALATGQMGDVLGTPARSLLLFAGGAAIGSVGMLLFFVTVSVSSVGTTYTTTSGLYILFTMAGGVLLLGESAGLWAIAGAAAILAGLYVLNSRPLRIAEAGTPRPAVGGMPGFTALALAVVTSACWAVDLVASKEALEEAGLLANGLVHQAVPAALFGCAVLLRPALRKPPRITGEKRRLALAACLYVGSTLTWSFALSNTDAGITALLASTSPVFALLLALVVLKEKLTAAAMAGAAIAFAGIVVVVASR